MHDLEFSNKPLISLVVPIYNLEEYVGILIDSTLEQTYTHWELVIVNDNSTDSSFDIINSYDDDRIKVINNSKNLGLSGSRNKGIMNSHGDYIQFIDGDDFLEKNALEIEVTHLIHTNADILHFNYNIVTLQRPLTDSEKRLEKISTSEGEYIGNKKLELLFNGSISHFAWSFILKSSIFDCRNNFFPEGRLFEDFSTTYKWLYASRKLYVSDKKLYNYMQRNTSIMHKPQLSHATDIKETVDELDIFASQSIPNLEKNVIRYELPRLLNAYGISLKSENSSKVISDNIRKKILKKIKVVGLHHLRLRDKIKVVLIICNFLQYLYEFKKK
ncbi:glycosyltransferase family 2 protein [Leuconostoc gelidum subsp. gelidum]|uniref:glycosyltransferase family 2 protein n=1 Tax=Leuconostoc gelidum TaxID=1244 RepID=UPI001CC603BA|nr:glycosyltransferase family 2 protein [Leuconostoc gelidum]MBZ6014021.1 glycosyltransferase family 2 protein [Leuconostoc gelidum subsp. gelidum]